MLYRCWCMFLCFFLWFVVPTKTWPLYIWTIGKSLFLCGHNCSFFPRRVTSIMMTRSTSTTPKLKQPLETTRRQKRWDTWAWAATDFFWLKLMVTCTNCRVSYRFFYSFRVRRSRMTMFISAGWHDAVCIVVKVMIIYLILNNKAMIIYLWYVAW